MLDVIKYVTYLFCDAYKLNAYPKREKMYFWSDGEEAWHPWLTQKVNKTEENVRFVFGLREYGFFLFFVDNVYVRLLSIIMLLFPFNGNHASWIMLKEDDTFAKVR